jgi:hypothetical protein
MLRNKVNAFNKKIISKLTKLNIKKQLNFKIEKHLFNSIKNFNINNETKANVIKIMY